MPCNATRCTLHLMLCPLSYPSLQPTVARQLIAFFGLLPCLGVNDLLYGTYRPWAVGIARYRLSLHHSRLFYSALRHLVSLPEFSSVHPNSHFNLCVRIRWSLLLGILRTSCSLISATSKGLASENTFFFSWVSECASSAARTPQNTRRYW